MIWRGLARSRRQIFEPFASSSSSYARRPASRTRRRSLSRTRGLRSQRTSRSGSSPLRHHSGTFAEKYKPSSRSSCVCFQLTLTQIPCFANLLHLLSWEIEPVLRRASPERLSTFSDGVFAVLITVLVLELRPPERPTFEALLALWPIWLSYAVSYVFIAIVWANHHYLMRYATEANSSLLWFNFAHLLAMSLLPISTAWMA